MVKPQPWDSLDTVHTSLGLIGHQHIYWQALLGLTSVPKRHRCRGGEGCRSACCGAATVEGRPPSHPTALFPCYGCPEAH